MRAQQWTAAALLALAGPAAAQQVEPGPEAGAVGRIRACRAIAATDQRLACFDQAAAALDQAIVRKDVVVLDRQELGRTRRSLFGLALPNLKLLTGDDGAEVKQVAIKVVGSRQVAYEKFDIQVEGGAVWRNVDLLPEPPRAGDTITLSKGAVGSFFLQAPGLPIVRAGRVR